jgi:hypothetical protein
VARVKKAFAAIILACMVFGFPGLVFAQDAENIVTVSKEVPRINSYIPRGTLIEAQLITGVNSGENGVNDVAYFKLTQNVIINGVVVLPSGTVGSAVVTVVKPATFLGKSGRIELQARPIQALNGAVVPLTLDIKKFGSKTSEDFGYEALSLYIAGIHQLGNFYSGFHGGEADIPAGTKFQVGVDVDADLWCTPDRLDVVMVKAVR